MAQPNSREIIYDRYSILQREEEERRKSEEEIRVGEREEERMKKGRVKEERDGGTENRKEMRRAI